MIRFAAAGVVAGGLALAALAAEPEPRGYRGDPYNAPVPATLTGAEVIDDIAAHTLWAAEDAVFVDVMPRPQRPAGLPEGTLWRDRPHASIPGAIWLPNTGYAALDAATLAYFLDGLAAATGGATDAPVVIFCRTDCWMSWNAAKRALEHGHGRVLWYPAGVDGWAAQGWPLEPVEPRPATP